MGSAGTKPMNTNSPVFLFIQELIRQNCIVIFSKSFCPYCKMAKEVFDKMNVSYKAIELDSRQDGVEIQDTLRDMTGARTVPRVFINGQCIGGGTETKKLFEDNKLRDLIMNCDSGSLEKTDL